MVRRVSYSFTCQHSLKADRNKVWAYGIKSIQLTIRPCINTWSQLHYYCHTCSWYRLASFEVRMFARWRGLFGCSHSPLFDYQNTPMIISRWCSACWFDTSQWNIWYVYVRSCLLPRYCTFLITYPYKLQPCNVTDSIWIPFLAIITNNVIIGFQWNK